MSPGNVVRTVLGDERTATRIYGDGSIDCPFCSNAISAERDSTYLQDGTCPNPWCDANPSWQPHALQAHREKREREAQEVAARARNHRAAMERISREREEQQEWEAQKIEEAKQRGACLRCLFQPGYRAVKFVRHRKECPKA
jgi:hypothetical protein